MQDADWIIGVVAVSGLFAFLSLWVIAAYMAQVIRAWHDNGLKREMVARGYSAKEIVAVVRCKRQSKCEEQALPDVPPAKPVRQPAYN
jgi:hypothetical protein